MFYYMPPNRQWLSWNKHVMFDGTSLKKLEPFGRQNVKNFYS